MLKFLHLLLTLMFLASSHYLPPSPQAHLINPSLDSAREKVPGDNTAYFTRVKKADQLFEIEEFTMSPNPVQA